MFCDFCGIRIEELGGEKINLNFLNKNIIVCNTCIFNYNDNYTLFDTDFYKINKEICGLYFDYINRIISAKNYKTLYKKLCSREENIKTTQAKINNLIIEQKKIQEKLNHFIQFRDKLRDTTFL